MAKRRTKNYYAIYFIDESRTEIVKSWTECQEKMKGHNNLFKGFITKDEAIEWLNSVSSEDVDKHNKSIYKKEKSQFKVRSDEKTYTVTLDREHYMCLDKFLKKSKISLSDYIKEIIELDLMTWQK